MLIKIYIETRIWASVFNNHVFLLSSSPVIILSISHFQCSAHKRLIPSPDITYSSCVVRIETLSCLQYMSEMWSMIHARLRHYYNVHTLSHGLVHNTPCWWCCKSSFFLMWTCICNTVSTQDNTTEIFFPLVAFLKLIDAYLSMPSAFSIFSPASTQFLRQYWHVHGDTSYLWDVLAYRKNIHVHVHA